MNDDYVQFTIDIPSAIILRDYIGRLLVDETTDEEFEVLDVLYYTIKDLELD